MEQEPILIEINGHEIELTPNNTAIVRYIAKYAIHNCIVIRNGLTPMYIFRETQGSDELNSILEDRLYPMAIHMPEPTEEVIERHAELIEMDAWDDAEEEIENWRRLFKNENEEEAEA